MFDFCKLLSSHFHQCPVRERTERIWEHSNLLHNSYFFHRLRYGETKNHWTQSQCQCNHIQVCKSLRIFCYKFQVRKVQQEEHLKRIFERHQKSPKHEEALTRQMEIKAMLLKGSVDHMPYSWYMARFFNSDLHC